MGKFELLKVVIHPSSSKSLSRVPTSWGRLKGNRKDNSFQMMKSRCISKKVSPREQTAYHRGAYHGIFMEGKCRVACQGWDRGDVRLSFRWILIENLRWIPFHQTSCEHVFVINTTGGLPLERVASWQAKHLLQKNKSWQVNVLHNV